MERSGIIFWNFAKPLLCEGRPEGELCAMAVQPQRVVQKASAARLLYNVQGFVLVWHLKFVCLFTKAQLLFAVEVKLFCPIA
jgi:hypothetical protein